MSRSAVHQCTCMLCHRPEPHPDQVTHRQMNLLLSQLNEAQRRWYAAAAAVRWGRGGIHYVAQITGLDPKTIRRGRQELAHEFHDLPPGRLRQPGAGRPCREKKIPRSNPGCSR